jgi:rod shape-determining protein MreD
VQISVTSSEQAQIQRFPWIITIGTPLIAVILQSYVPIHLHFFSILDLPLLVTLVFSVARRSPVGGVFTGAIIGIVQDSLTHQPLGVFGISKTVVGYLGSSLSLKLDVENPGSQFLMTLVFYVVHQGIYLFVARGLAEEALQLNWGHLPIAAVINGLLAVPLFAALDKVKQPA